MRFIFLAGALFMAPFSMLGAGIFFAGYVAVGYLQMQNNF